jgi:hypothetical protein
MLLFVLGIILIIGGALKLLSGSVLLGLAIAGIGAVCIAVSDRNKLDI